jgi:hypothetical protein
LKVERKRKAKNLEVFIQRKTERSQRKAREETLWLCSVRAHPQKEAVKKARDGGCARVWPRAFWVAGLRLPVHGVAVLFCAFLFFGQLG